MKRATGRSARSLAGALALAVAALVPFGGRAAEPYTIYVIVSLTGTAAFLGREEANAVAVIQNSVNKKGGVRGRPIAFVVQDDGSNAENAVLLLNQDVAKGATAILGSSLVSECAAMLPLVNNGPLVYCFSPGMHPPPGSYMFSSNISTADFIVATIRYLRDRGWRKIALLTSTDATGQDAEHGIAAAIAAPENQGGVTLIDTERFNVSDISVAAQIAKIKASGAQAAILWASGTPFGTLLREAVQDGLNIPLFTSAANLNRVQLNGYRSFMPDDLYLAAPAWTAPSEFPDPALRRTIAAYLETFGAVGIRAESGAGVVVGSDDHGARRAAREGLRREGERAARLHRRAQRFRRRERSVRHASHPATRDRDRLAGHDPVGQGQRPGRREQAGRRAALMAQRSTSCGGGFGPARPCDVR